MESTLKNLLKEIIQREELIQELAKQKNEKEIFKFFEKQGYKGTEEEFHEERKNIMENLELKINNEELNEEELSKITGGTNKNIKSFTAAALTLSLLAGNAANAVSIKNTKPLTTKEKVAVGAVVGAGLSTSIALATGMIFGGKKIADTIKKGNSPSPSGHQVSKDYNMVLLVSLEWPLMYLSKSNIYRQNEAELNKQMLKLILLDLKPENGLQGVENSNKALEALKNFALKEGQLTDDDINQIALLCRSLKDRIGKDVIAENSKYVSKNGFLSKYQAQAKSNLGITDTGSSQTESQPGDDVQTQLKEEKYTLSMDRKTFISEVKNRSKNIKQDMKLITNFVKLLEEFKARIEKLDEEEKNISEDSDLLDLTLNIFAHYSVLKSFADSSNYIYYHHRDKFYLLLCRASSIMNEHDSIGGAMEKGVSLKHMVISIDTIIDKAKDIEKEKEKILNGALYYEIYLKNYSALKPKYNTECDYEDIYNSINENFIAQDFSDSKEVETLNRIIEMLKDDEEHKDIFEKLTEISKKFEEMKLKRTEQLAQLETKMEDCKGLREKISALDTQAKEIHENGKKHKYWETYRENCETFTPAFIFDDGLLYCFSNYGEAEKLKDQLTKVKNLFEEYAKQAMNVNGFISSLWASKPDSSSLLQELDVLRQVNNSIDEEAFKDEIGKIRQLISSIEAAVTSDNINKDSVGVITETLQNIIKKLEEASEEKATYIDDNIETFNQKLFKDLGEIKDRSGVKASLENINKEIEEREKNKKQRNDLEEQQRRDYEEKYEEPYRKLKLEREQAMDELKQKMEPFVEDLKIYRQGYCKTIKETINSLNLNND